MTIIVIIIMLITVILIESFINFYISKVNKNMGVNVYKTLDQRPLNSPSSSSTRMKLLMIISISFIAINKKQYFYLTILHNIITLDIMQWCFFRCLLTVTSVLSFFLSLVLGPYQHNMNE